MGTYKIKAWGVTKAGLATAIFLAAGIISYMWNGDVHPAIALFYLMLCINTFFSIRLFGSLVPMSNIEQVVIDTILFFMYLTLAWFLPSPKIALGVAVVLFIIGTIKYAQLVDRMPLPKLLTRKLTVEAFATLALFIAYIGVLFGNADVFLWSWAGIFVCANIYLLLIRPLYTLRQ